MGHRNGSRSRHERPGNLAQGQRFRHGWGRSRWDGCSCRARQRNRPWNEPGLEKARPFWNVLTYRFRGHSLADPDELRAEEEKQFWAKRDPLKALERELLEAKLVTSEELRAIEKEIDAEVQDCVDFRTERPRARWV